MAELPFWLAISCSWRAFSCSWRARSRKYNLQTSNLPYRALPSSSSLLLLVLTTPGCSLLPRSGVIVLLSVSELMHSAAACIPSSTNTAEISNLCLQSELQSRSVVTGSCSEADCGQKHICRLSLFADQSNVHDWEHSSFKDHIELCRGGPTHLAYCVALATVEGRQLVCIGQNRSAIVLIDCL